MRRAWLAGGAAALLLGAFAAPVVYGRQRAAAPPSASSAELVPLVIETRRGPRRFRVEVARTAEQQERGLMFRTSVPAGTGMIFPMSPPRQATFWMKNTLVPLDMIFIRFDGTIARIAANTKPESLDLVDSGEPVSAVLEIAGGAAARQGIAEGDVVRWAATAPRG